MSSTDLNSFISKTIRKLRVSPNLGSSAEHADDVIDVDGLEEGDLAILNQVLHVVLIGLE